MGVSAPATNTNNTKYTGVIIHLGKACKVELQRV